MKGKSERGGRGEERRMKKRKHKSIRHEKNVRRESQIDGISKRRQSLYSPFSFTALRFDRRRCCAFVAYIREQHTYYH